MCTTASSASVRGCRRNGSRTCSRRRRCRPRCRGRCFARYRGGPVGHLSAQSGTLRPQTCRKFGCHSDGWCPTLGVGRKSVTLHRHSPTFCFTFLRPGLSFNIVHRTVTVPRYRLMQTGGLGAAFFRTFRTFPVHGTGCLRQGGAYGRTPCHRRLTRCRARGRWYLAGMARRQT